MMVFTKKNKKTINIVELDEKLSLLKIPLSMVLTPINLASEQEKFFDSSDYNPQFKYKVVKNNNDEILKELLQLEEVVDVDPLISDFYLELIQSKKLAHDLMSSVGDNKLVTELSLQKFRMPTEILFRNSCRIIRGKYNNYDVLDTSSLKKSDYLYYDCVSNAFNCVFEVFGLSDWKVQKSKNIRKNGVKVGIKSKEVFVDPDISKTPLNLKKTIVHELTHILRSHNGALSGVSALAKPNLNSYLDIEEGLAMFNEEQMGYLKDVDLKERASVVYAMYIGEKMSFRDLYNVMFCIYPKCKAFYIASLVKRGMGDTSLPGIYTKSAVYLRGFRKVRKKLSEDASLYKKLYSGKIGFNQLKWVEEGLVREASIVPTVEDFHSAFKKAQI